MKKCMNPKICWVKVINYFWGVINDKIGSFAIVEKVQSKVDNKYYAAKIFDKRNLKKFNAVIIFLFILLIIIKKNWTFFFFMKKCLK